VMGFSHEANRRHGERPERQSQHRADPHAPRTHRQNVFCR
jgi:hypothetical protein